MNQSATRQSHAQPGKLWDDLAAAVGRAARPLDLLARSDQAAMAYSVARTEPVPDLFALCDEIITRIPPHETIYRPDSGVRDANGRVQPYLLRWHLRPKQTGRSQFALYLHRFLQPDETVLHDHPWPSASWLLFGEQNEVWKTTGGTAGPPSRHRLVPGSPRQWAWAANPRLGVLAGGPVRARGRVPVPPVGDRIARCRLSARPRVVQRRPGRGAGSRRGGATGRSRVPPKRPSGRCCGNAGSGKRR
jgi:hypothetical protein